MITVEALTKKYRGFTAVDDVTFTARSGRVTGFLGPNGAGKSTTMRMMVGLTQPTSGTATINGRPFADLPNPGLDVGVLINNVGKSYDMPEFYQNLPDQDIADIVEINMCVSFIRCSLECAR